MAKSIFPPFWSQSGSLLLTESMFSRKVSALTFTIFLFIFLKLFYWCKSVLSYGNPLFLFFYPFVFWSNGEKLKLVLLFSTPTGFLIFSQVFSPRLGYGWSVDWVGGFRAPPGSSWADVFCWGCGRWGFYKKRPKALRSDNESLFPSFWMASFPCFDIFLSPIHRKSRGFYALKGGTCFCAW